MCYMRKANLTQIQVYGLVGRVWSVTTYNEKKFI